MKYSACCSADMVKNISGVKSLMSASFLSSMPFVVRSIESPIRELSLSMVHPTLEEFMWIMSYFNYFDWVAKLIAETLVGRETFSRLKMKFYKIVMFYQC